MVWETQWFLEIPVRLSPLVLFVFFATLFEYNLHIISGRISLLQPAASFREIMGAGVSLTLKTSIAIGFLGSAITFFMLENEQMICLLIAGMLALSYSVPMIRIKGKLIRIREITFLKVFTVAFVWTFITVIIPILPVIEKISVEELIIIFTRRFLFIFAITIPFEIQDIEREKVFGNISLPMIYGVKRMKLAGIIILVLFCILSSVQEKRFLFDIFSRNHIFIPLLISAIFAGYQVLNASDKKTSWYYKFWTDGTLILQFLLLILFDQ